MPEGTLQKEGREAMKKKITLPEWLGNTASLTHAMTDVYHNRGSKQISNWQDLNCPMSVCHSDDSSCRLSIRMEFFPFPITGLEKIFATIWEAQLTQSGSFLWQFSWVIQLACSPQGILCGISVLGSRCNLWIVYWLREYFSTTCSLDGICNASCRLDAEDFDEVEAALSQRPRKRQKCQQPFYKFKYQNHAACFLESEFSFRKGQ